MKDKSALAVAEAMNEAMIEEFVDFIASDPTYARNVLMDYLNYINQDINRPLFIDVVARLIAIKEVKTRQHL